MCDICEYINFICAYVESRTKENRIISAKNEVKSRQYRCKNLENRGIFATKDNVFAVLNLKSYSYIR